MRCNKDIQRLSYQETQTRTSGSNKKMRVELAFSKGKINEKHYDLLNKAISKLDSKEGNNNNTS